MTSLSQLADDYHILCDLVADEDDPTAFETAVAQLQGAIERKVENIGLLVKLLEHDVAIEDAEIKRLSTRKKQREGRIAWLKDYIASHLPDGKRYDFPLVSVYWAQNPPSVLVQNAEIVPPPFVRIIPERREIDKVAIKDHWRTTGEVIPGVEIVTNAKRVVIR